MKGGELYAKISALAQIGRRIGDIRSRYAFGGCSEDKPSMLRVYLPFSCDFCCSSSEMS